MHDWLQLSPVSSTRQSQAFAVDGQSPLSRNWDDAKFFRLCLAYDSRIKSVRMNWNKVLGLGMATVVSLTLWLGLGFVIARLL